MLGALLFSTCLFGCNDISKVKEQSIKNIDSVISEIKTKKPEYSMILIEITAKEAKSRISDSIDPKEILSIEQETLEQLNLLTLTSEESNEIKGVYAEWKSTPIYSYPINDVHIKYFLGRIDNKYIVAIQGHYPQIMLNPMEYYFCFVDTEVYRFDYLPEVLCVFDSDKFYDLPDACKNGLLSKDEVDEIYYKYIIILDNMEDKK